MKTLLLILILFTLSCSKECDDELKAIENQYREALKHASTPAAVDEITRQYNQRKANLDC